MRELSPYDLHRVVAKLPTDLVNHLDTLPFRRPLYIAGGFIRAVVAGEEPHDIDLFAAGTPALEASASQLLAMRPGGRLHRTQNAITVLAPPRMPLQFITRWVYDDPAKLIEQFDFTIAQAVIWCSEDTWHSLCSDEFYPDLAARRLTYTYPEREQEDAAGSILRAFKFARRGYHIPPPSIGGVVARMVSHLPQDPQQTLASMGERWLGEILCKVIRQVDPLDVVDGVDIVEEQQDGSVAHKRPRATA